MSNESTQDWLSWKSVSRPVPTKKKLEPPKRMRSKIEKNCHTCLRSYYEPTGNGRVAIRCQRLDDNKDHDPGLPREVSLEYSLHDAITTARQTWCDLWQRYLLDDKGRKVTAYGLDRPYQPRKESDE